MVIGRTAVPLHQYIYTLFINNIIISGQVDKSTV